MIWKGTVINTVSPWYLYFKKQCTQGLIISIKTHLALLSKKKYQYCRDPNSTMYLLSGPKYPAWLFCAFNLTFGKLAVDKCAWAMGFQSWRYYSPVLCLWANVFSFLNTCLLLLSKRERLVPWLVGWSGPPGCPCLPRA